MQGGLLAKIPPISKDKGSFSGHAGVCIDNLHGLDMGSIHP